MTVASTPTIIQTERGLSIAGTRITLYDVMDYVTAGWPISLIRAWLPLTESQLNTALEYIESHRAEVEMEYQQVLNEAEELRQYYEEKNHDLMIQIASQSPKPGTEAIWKKLQTSKKKLGLI